MRILQVCSARVMGGGEVHVDELTRKLRERGHEVRVAGRAEGPLELDHRLPFFNSVDIYSAVRLARIVASGQFDIVHAHVARDYPIVAGALWRLRKPKLVLTRQLVFPVRGNPIYRRVDGWIVTTDQILRSIAHLKPRATAIVPNWVELGRFDYGARPLRKPIALGLLGQVSPHKGHDDAIEAMRRLGPDYRLLVAGNGEPSYVDRLRAKAQDLPVEFLGFVRPEDFLPRVDVLLVPSWEEPFGIVIVEAMAAGVNVIATDAGGPPEILDWGKAGVLVPPKNPAELAGAVRRLQADGVLRLALREQARERVRKRYDISLTVPRIEEFYMQLRGKPQDSI